MRWLKRLLIAGVLVGLVFAAFTTGRRTGLVNAPQRTIATA